MSEDDFNKALTEELDKVSSDSEAQHIDPKHYKGDTVATFIETMELNWKEAFIVKYIARKTKTCAPRSRDLRKALWYLERELKNVQEQEKKIKEKQVYTSDRKEGGLTFRTFQGEQCEGED